MPGALSSAHQSTHHCSAPQSTAVARRMKRQPTHPAAPASAAPLTQGADGETFTSFTGTILQNLLQCAALAAYARQEEQEGGSTGSFCLPCLHLWLAPTHTSSPARWPRSMKHCFGNGSSSVASTEDGVEMLCIRSLAAKLCSARCFFKGNFF